MMMTLQRIARWDYLFSRTCLNHKFNRQVAQIARWISRSGDGYLYVILGVTLLSFEIGNAMAFTIHALQAYLIELSVYFVVKNSFRRHRPRELPVFIKPSDTFSFPSGHTAGAFVMASCICLYYPQWTPLAFSWAAFVGLSRVLLGVHFITDIFAGALLGSVAVWLMS
jgi:undecaprenyl-diphosphatase